jgi:hypothetical protein
MLGRRKPTALRKQSSVFIEGPEERVRAKDALIRVSHYAEC